MSCTIPTPPFDLTLTLGTAPSWPFTLEDDSAEPPEPVSLAGAALWFAAKVLPTDADASAVILASSANGKISITDADAGEFQVDLTESDTAPTATFIAGRAYFAFLRVQLASGEIRERSGWLTTLPGGIEAP